MTTAHWAHSPTPKVKKTVSLDADLVAAVGEGNLSFELNEALAERLVSRRRTESLRSYLDRYAAEEGGFDETQVQEYMTLLGGPTGA